MKLPVMDITGAQIGTLEVSDSLFGVPANQPVVHQAMVRQLANARQGTSSTKTRAMVSGGGAKPRPQKHSGRARQGSIRSPQYAGGGIVFGPSPRSFRQSLPKKMRRLAIRCLLSDKARENRLTLLQNMDLPTSRTKEMVNVLKALDAASSTLIVTHPPSSNVVLSARNIKKVKTLPASNINVLDLLEHDRLIMTVDAVHRAEELWAGGVTSVEVEMEPKTRTRRRASSATTRGGRSRRTRASAEPEATATPEPEAAVEVEPEATAAPEPEAAVEVESEATAAPEPEAAAEVESEATAAPEPEAAVEVESEATAAPEPEAAVEVESEAAAAPEPEAAVEVEPEATAAPEPETPESEEERKET